MNELKFLGNGSAFNTKLGNTSAYVKNKDSMILMDCGNDVFHKLKEKNLLTGVKNLYIIITHTHADHVGSLSDLLFYCHYMLNVLPILFFPKSRMLEDLLQIQGVSCNLYNINDNHFVHFTDTNFGIVSFTFFEQVHVKWIPAYRVRVSVLYNNFYYSGDGTALTPISLQLLEKGAVDRLYQDTCGIDYEDNPHLYIGKLAEIIKPEYRNKVYCIHIDEKLTKEIIQEYGFNYIEIE